MRGSEVFSLGAQLNLERESGLVVFGIFARLSDEVEPAGRALPGLTLTTRLRRPPGAYLMGQARTLVEAGEIDRQVRAIPGVRTTFLSIPAGSYYARDTLREWIRERITTWETARFHRGPTAALLGTA